MPDAKEPFIVPEELAERLSRDPYVVVLTGAGVSAESGVPTFRDAQTGLWEKFRPEELASPEAFERDPKMVWQWYAWRRELIEKVDPNPGHYALAEMERRLSRFLLITQNVDGLHQQAGSRKVIELHGNIRKTLCSRTHRTIDDAWLNANPGEPPPSPHHPQGHARPGVVWFGEALPADALQQAAQAITECDLMIVAGTSGLVEPAASLPRWAKDHGAVVVDINPERTSISALADFYLQGASGEWLPAAVKRM
ncbi:MAG: NAD-dependent deacylase [Wenzhouxiangellaceae bacterium]